MTCDPVTFHLHQMPNDTGRSWNENLESIELFVSCKISSGSPITFVLPVNPVFVVVLDCFEYTLPVMAGDFHEILLLPKITSPLIHGGL